MVQILIIAVRQTVYGLDTSKYARTARRTGKPKTIILLAQGTAINGNTTIVFQSSIRQESLQNPTQFILDINVS